MQLKITTDYAIRTILYLSLRMPEVITSLEISKTMGIPRKYLIYVGSILKQAGLLETHPGKYGGYSLAKRPEEITLFEIVDTMEDTTKINRCLEEDEYCSRFATKDCPVRKCYTVMQRAWECFLKGLTVTDILSDMTEEEIETYIVHPC